MTQPPRDGRTDGLPSIGEAIRQAKRELFVRLTHRRLEQTRNTDETAEGRKTVVAQTDIAVADRQWRLPFIYFGVRNDCTDDRHRAMAGQAENSRTCCFGLAGEPGFEPRQTESEVCCATVTPFPNGLLSKFNRLKNCSAIARHGQIASASWPPFYSLAAAFGKSVRRNDVNASPRAPINRANKLPSVRIVIAASPTSALPITAATTPSTN